MVDPVIMLWVAVGASVGIFVLVRSWSRRAPADGSLGTVSDQWLAEQRLNRPDSQR